MLFSIPAIDPFKILKKNVKNNADIELRHQGKLEGRIEIEIKQQAYQRNTSKALKFNV